MSKKKKHSKKNTSVSSKNQKTKNQGFWKAVWEIIINKRDTEKHFTNTALSLIISLFFNIIAIIMTITAAYGVVDGICGFVSSISLSISAAFEELTQILLAITMGLLALILRGMANEAKREKDSNYLVSLFSGLTGFVALIVALIALSRGVA